MNNPCSWDDYSPDFRVENRVITCDTGVPLNLPFLARKLKNMGPEYNPKKFAAVIMRARNVPRKNNFTNYQHEEWTEESQKNSAVSHFLHHIEPPKKTVGEERHKRPKIACLLFSPGKVVCTGSKTDAQALHAISQIITAIKKIGYSKAEISSFQLENLVGSIRLPGDIDLAKLADKYSSFCTYDPEQFPGAILRYPSIAPMTILVFRYGKLVVTGARTSEDAKTQFMEVYPILKECAIDFTKQSKYEGDSFVKPTNQLNQLVDDFIEKLIFEKLNSDAEKRKRECDENDEDFDDEDFDDNARDKEEEDIQIIEVKNKRRKLEEKNNQMLKFPSYEILVQTLKDNLEIIFENRIPKASLQSLKLVGNKIKVGLIPKLAELLGTEGKRGAIETCIGDAWESLYINCSLVETIALTCLQDEIIKNLLEELKNIGVETS